jgi:hypothetical protein
MDTSLMSTQETWFVPNPGLACLRAAIQARQSTGVDAAIELIAGGGEVGGGNGQRGEEVLAPSHRGESPEETS